MPTYTHLIRFAQQNIEHIAAGPSLLEAGKKAFQEAGAEIKEFYSVLGQHDAIAVTEAPDDEAIARLSLALGANSNIHIQSLRRSQRLKSEQPLRLSREQMGLVRVRKSWAPPAHTAILPTR